MALYLQHLVEETHSPSAVDSAFYGLKWAHDVVGIPSPTDDPIVEAVRSASEGVLGSLALIRKEPISPTLIPDIVKKSDLENPVVLRNVTMYVLSFAAFFRFDEVSRIRRSKISLKDSFMVIKVLKSKNDQLCKGDEVVVSQLSGAACPLELLKRYLAGFKIPPDSKDLIFKLISRGKGCCKLVAPVKPISSSTIRGTFRLRSGGATMAAANGVNDRIFQRHGHWKSAQSKDTYADDDLV